jgi:hypothetical protein
MNALKTGYRYLSDHLTKALGALGGGTMTVALMDPAPIRDAAQTYLGQQWAPKIGIALFGLVILRGLYTGKKAKQLEAAQPPVA